MLNQLLKPLSLKYWLLNFSSMIYQPSHLCSTLKDDILPAFSLSITKAAAQLGIARNTLSRLINGHAAITPEIAIRIEKWLGVENGGRADVWLAEQAAYDLWQARSKFKGNIKLANLKVA